MEKTVEKKTVIVAQTYGYENGFRPRKATPEKIPGKSLTKPGMAVEIKLTMEKYSVPTLAAQLKTYYDRENLVNPGFERMDRIDQLMAHAEMREDVKNKFRELKNEMKKQQDKDKADQIKAAEERGRKAASQTALANQSQEKQK